MTDTAQRDFAAAPPAEVPALVLEERLRSAALWMIVAILAIAPFPLGSNRAWSWSLLGMLTAAAGFIWLVSVWRRPELVVRDARRVAGPLLLAALALVWGVIQIVPLVPNGAAHPVWGMAAAALGRNISATISLDPWRTETELMKLSTYVLVAGIIYSLSREAHRARLILNAIAAIGVFYIVYAWVFAAADWRQFVLFYNLPDIGNRVASPFVNKNTLATYAGLVSLCCWAVFFEDAAKHVVVGRGARWFFSTAIQYTLGRKSPLFLASLVSLSLVVATGSLGGTIATFLALLAMALLSGVAIMRARIDRWTVVTALAVVILLIAIFTLNGNALVDRLDNIASSGLSENLRVDLWSSTLRMVSDSPLLGLGLGTFERAYPLYAQSVLPFIMDKAHNDYLELAAGWGLPAAFAWWGALVWLAALCLRGVFARHRDRLHPLLALGAITLVGVHAAFDFSLQIPAVAILFAALLGLGTAQAFSSREKSQA